MRIVRDTFPPCNARSVLTFVFHTISCFSVAGKRADVLAVAGWEKTLHTRRRMKHSLFSSRRAPFLVVGFLVIVAAAILIFQSKRVAPAAQPADGNPVSGRQLPSPEAREKTAKILAVGDIMLGRAVETLMKKYGEDYPFALIKEKLASADLVVGNLEGPIPDSHTQTPDSSLRFSFSPSTAALLAKHNVRSVSTANNHAHDAGRKGFEQTRARLASEGVEAFGDPSMKGASCRPVTAADPRVVLCAFSVFANFNEQAALVELREARKRHSSSYLMLMPHWGNEYQAVASTVQVRLAHAFIDAGVDAIVGSHPHVVQNIELYRDRPIFYSLGNFIFDQYFSQETQMGLAVDITLSADDVVLGLMPLISRRSQPAEMAEDEAERFRNDLAERSPTAASAVQAGKLHLKR